MARASAAAENAAVGAVAGISPDLSLHTADPGTTGANEVSGGAYARQGETWGSAASGQVANTNAIAVPIPANTTVPYVGHWSAATGGTYSIGGAMSSSIATGASAANVTFAAGADVLAGS